MDVTSLNGDDTDARIGRLLDDVVQTFEEHGVHPAAVCVFPAFIKLAKSRLESVPVKVATVAAGFPHGLSPLQSRIDDVAACLEAGANEIDVVIRRRLALESSWTRLEDEVARFRQAAGNACLKVILEVSELQDEDRIREATLISVQAGADFLKTSTGKASETATLDQGRAVLRAIQEVERSTGRKVGFKAAGGIRTSIQAAEWMDSAREILGSQWLNPSLFRIGTSALFESARRVLQGGTDTDEVHYPTQK